MEQSLSFVCACLFFFLSTRVSFFLQERIFKAVTTNQSAHSLIIYLLSACYVSGTVLNVKIKKMDMPSISGKRQDDSIT
jgi:hypothetical protein